MAIRDNLKAYFHAGLRPNQANFEELIDKTVNLVDDKANDSEAVDLTNDGKYITPKTANLIVKNFILSGLSTSLTGVITVTDKLIDALSKLQNQIGLKQDSLKTYTAVSPTNANLKTIDGNSILYDLNNPTVTNIVPRASKLITPIKLNGISFDGSTDIFVQKMVGITGNNVFQNSSTLRADVTGLSFSVLAGKKYKIELIGDYQTTDLATGVSLGFVITGGTANIKGYATIETSISFPNNSGIKMSITSLVSTTAPGSFITSSGVSIINAPHNLSANLVLSCVTNGVFQVQWGSGVNTLPATLNSGTILIITQLN